MSRDVIHSDVINKIIGEIVSTTLVPIIQFEADSNKETTIFNSKIGGKPYLPKGFEYPKTYDDEPHPLALLAQINFEEFEELEDFPNKGILQFYINNDRFYGKDYHDLTNSNGFRVIYHDNIVTDESLLVDPPELSEGQLPFSKTTSVKLVGKKSDMAMSMNDLRMDDLVVKYASKYDIDEDELRDQLWECDSFHAHDSKVGGYGNFSQEDPRGCYEGKYKDYLVTLFTSESGTGTMWWDEGVANFFIKKEDLLKKKFNDVLYTWDSS
ncbi:DUF1963 domain-containing protein [Entamoeba marina]